MIRKERGKVYPGAVNNKRKRYVKDLKSGVAHKKNGEIVCDPNTGVAQQLKPNHKSYRAGYNQACAENAAAAKTAAGLKANEKMPNGVKIINVAVDSTTNKPLTANQLAKVYNVK